MPISHSAWAERMPLLDYRAIDWSRIKRTRYFCYQRFHYQYPGPISNLRQRLIVVPPDRYGDQTLVEHELTTAPHPAIARQRTDAFGNRIWELSTRHVEREIAFEAIVTVERTMPPQAAVARYSEVVDFYKPTDLTAPNERINAVAFGLAAATQDSEELAEQISGWVADHMQYGSGATGVQTSAAHALAIGKGLCQDYAHIMLSICRAAGLPARYVSGHMLAEGGSHAWVEVLLPAHDGNFHAVAFDPTNRRRPDLSYAIVAVGRDYRDVAPTSGSFSAPYGGQLSSTKHAGLTLVEFADGEVIGGTTCAPA